MHLKKLDNSFYTDNAHLKEALDNYNGRWESGKVRGYGVVVISINNLTFAIPLRSNIRHSASYITLRNKSSGLDFSKALLISDEKYISDIPFKIDYNQHKNLVNKEHYITQKFEHYVSRYIFAIKKEDENILSSSEYRYSTLVNYHQELGIL